MEVLNIFVTVIKGLAYMTLFIFHLLRLIKLIQNYDNHDD